MDHPDYETCAENNEVFELACLKGRHLREIARLQSLREVNVNVTETRYQERMLLRPGVRMRVPVLCDETPQEVVWIPPVESVEEAKIVRTEYVEVTRRILPVVAPVEGRFLRQLNLCVGLLCDVECLEVMGDELLVWGFNGDLGIQVFGMDGTHKRPWEVNSARPGLLRRKYDNLLVADGYVLVNESAHDRLRLFTEKGVFLWQMDGVDASGGMAKMGDHFIVCDGERGCVMVVGVEMSAKAPSRWSLNGGGPEQFDVMVLGVAVLGDEVFVSDCDNHLMQVYKLDGTLVRQWGGGGAGPGGSGREPGEFKGPQGVAVRGSEVIVCDHGNNRVQVFGVDGVFVRQWHVAEPHRVVVSVDEVFVVGADDCVYVFV
jgi:hypothetical protein